MDAAERKAAKGLFMQEAEFDRFAQAYREVHAQNIGASGEAPEFFAEYKVLDLSGIVAERGLRPRHILDFGAGVGTSVPYFRAHLHGASLTCLDVSKKSLEIGRSRFSAQASFQRFDGQTLPFDRASFDVVFCACVFHHIEPAAHEPLLKELRRILTPGGVLIVFEHNPWNPLTVRAVNTCPFDENAVLISAPVMAGRVARAGFSGIERRFRIFFPHPLRALRPLEQWLHWCPLGAQYLVAATK